MGRKILNLMLRPGYNRLMPKATITVTSAALLASAFLAATSADAQTRHHRQHEREPKEVEHPVPAVPPDKRDSVVAAPGAYTGRPYWLVLAQCGGIYFRLNVLYTDIAVHARAVKPDPKLNTEYTKKLNDAIKAATVFFNGAEHLLRTDRGLERVDAVLTYDEQSLAAGNRLKTIDAALAAAKTCPVLYQACQQAYPKACSETLGSIS
jgi:hypothetical protein